MTIAIQGSHGSFHHEAAQKIYGTDVRIISCVTFRDVFLEVRSDRADIGLVAIENNIHGPINHTYRLLMENDVWIVADIRMRIHQCLISCQETSLGVLQSLPNLRVRSQSPALEQVAIWLDNNLPNATKEESSDTAASVADVVTAQDPTLVAVAGHAAALTHGGYVVAESIEDEPDNFTRFIAFQKAHETSPDATMCSIIVRTDHTPGALLRALKLFDEHGINLTKLDSRPIPGDKEHYRFYVDFAARDNSPEALSILAGLREQGCEVKVLGCYTRLQA